MQLTKQSKQLLYFFTKHKHIDYIYLNNKTKIIFKELYEKMIEAYSFIKKQLIFKANIKKIETAHQITKPKNFNYKSFPETVRNHIDHAIMSEISFSFSLCDRTIKVYFLVENSHPELEIDTFNGYIQTIAMWLYVLNNYASKKCVKNISIYIYLTSLQKQLPESNIHVLDENNVNTAFTTTCPVDSEIVVFRKEEWFKALIHETFHNFGLDFSGMNNYEINKCILSIFDVNSEVNAFEAYTEFWAGVINALFCSFLGLENKNDVHEFLSSSEFYINFERKYSFFQLVKTLQFMGLKYSDLYSSTRQAKLHRDTLYKENTNVLSYYVLKTILLNNYQGFLAWCKSQNYLLLDFKKTIGNQLEFCKYINKNYKCQSILNGISDAENFLRRLKRKRGNAKFFLNNMRMTICELG